MSPIRLTAIPLLVAVVILDTAGIPAVARSSGVEQRDTAVANILLPTKKPRHFRWYGAQVLLRRDSGSGDVGLLRGGIVYGHCDRSGGQEKPTLLCFGTKLPLDGVGDTFEMSPDGSTGFFRHEHDGIVHTVEWQGSNPDPFARDQECPNQEGTMGVTREANVNASIFGKDLQSAPRKGVFLLNYMQREFITEGCDRQNVVLGRPPGPPVFIVTNE
jgi:hypothetical protein